MKATQSVEKSSSAALADLATDTPAERRKRKVRDMIIEAAEQVFAAEGEAGLSMRRLAERIDYSPAAIYKYFRSKDELLATIREQFFERLMDKLNQIFEGADYDKASFCNGLKAYVQTGVENPYHYLMAFAEFDKAPPDEGTLQYDAAVLLESMIQALVDKGVFRPVKAELASKSVWASLHGMTGLMACLPDFPEAFDEEPGTVSRDELMDFHINQIFRGLA